MQVHLLNYGAVIQSLLVPNAQGELIDTVLGFNNVAAYEKDTYYVGRLVGRNANRIKGAQVTISGKIYTLEANNGNNNLHSGNDYFGNQIWEASLEDGQLTLSYLSKDGEGGFPGNVLTQATFALDEGNCLTIQLNATTDADTLINLTRHEYFNFTQKTGNTIYDHFLKLEADRFTPKKEDGLPTGEIKMVTGTALDFTGAKRIGPQAAQLKPGFDHNFVLNDRRKSTLAATLQAPNKSLTMEVHCTQPGLQCYDGHHVTSFKGTTGFIKAPGSGICLEPQFFPDAPHHPNFPSTIVKAGSAYEHTIKYVFK